MPYKSISALPDSVKNVLPQHAQEIYQAAFNNAWNEYKEPQKRTIKASREEIAHKVAWVAVKKKYVKKGDNWKER